MRRGDDGCREKLRTRSSAWFLVLVAWGVASLGSGEEPASARAAVAPPAATDALLTPPPADGPVVVRARFAFQDVNEISDSLETFEFTGVLTLTWRDPRVAFDPAVAGVEEKVYQGGYQFDEIATGWYPQAVLVNASGLDERSGVVLRVRPDGTSTSIQTVDAVAEVELDMHRFPFDRQRLEAVFGILGFDRNEVRFEVEPAPEEAPASGIHVPQWSVTDAAFSVRDLPAGWAAGDEPSSAFVAALDVERDPFFVNRLVLAPQVVIVLLSFTVFWMDRSSLGDRISVSFIGILTAVAYQMVMSETMPRIAYVTLMHGLLNLSFLTMCATVVINLIVGSLDKRGEQERGDRIDYLCRWIFPLVYFGLMAAMIGAAHVLY